MAGRLDDPIDGQRGRSPFQQVLQTNLGNVAVLPRKRCGTMVWKRYEFTADESTFEDDRTYRLYDR